MKRWYAKELSRLTNISVRTLHHYDHINLLKPSLRLDNGYRLYSEQDLLKLQQIIALKFFGFELNQIKILLANHKDVLNNLVMQAKLLQDKAQNLMNASELLNRIVNKSNEHKSIPWQSVIELIEVYQMTQQLEERWIKAVFTKSELEQYAKFQTELKQHISEKDQQQFKLEWADLIKEIKDNLATDPNSITGIQIGERCFRLIDRIYGKKYANLRTILWEKGFKEGKNMGENGLTPELVTWLDQAMSYYWHERIYHCLDQLDKGASAKNVYVEWQAILYDMFGDEIEAKQVIYQMAMEDKRISTKAKQWLVDNPL